MKLLVTYLTLLISLSTFGQGKVTPADLKIIVGSWEGNITYLDYQTNKPFTMSANLIVEQGKDENSLVLNNIYPNEPKANNTDKIKISKNGSQLNKNKVTSRELLKNGQIQILTEHAGKDDNQKALIRNTYIISKNLFLIRKEVQFEGTDDWIKRSELNYKRKK